MTEWRVQLTGEKFDLEYAAEYFRLPELTVKREADDFYFSSNEFDVFAQAEYETVHSSAKALLVQINALAKLRFRNFQPLEMGNVAYVTDEGSKSNYIFLEAALVIRSKTGTAQLTITDANGQIVTSDQKTYQDLGERLKILNEDPYVAKAVEIYGSLEHDFNNLYLVLEVIAESVSGVHNLYKKPWASESAIRNFKDTANNYSGNGKYARHAKTTDRKPKHIMSLYEAQTMISNLLNKWIDDRLES